MNWATGGREYWHQQLDRASDIALAADWRHDPMSPRRAAAERIRWPAGLDPAGNGPAGNEREATMLAAWYAVLHRHTNQADLLVGTRRADKALPLRTVFDPAAPFRELVAATSDTLAASLRHCDAVTEREMAELLAIHELSIQVGFTMESQNVREDPEFGLELIVEEAGPRLAYDATRYSRPTAARLLSHFGTALSEGLRAPRTPVRRLRVETEPIPPPPAWPLSEPEGWVPAAITPESLTDRFRSIVAAYPDRLAVRGASGEYRYAELDRLSTAMAERLHRQVSAGQRLALLCEHDIGLAVGIWSILKAGSGYVPLDPRQPDERLARTIADAQATAVVCDLALAGRAAVLASGKPVIALGSVPPGRTSELPAVPPDAVAYLLQTSGTTGGPKAVMQIHSNVLAHALTYANRARIGPRDRIPLLARFTFDLAVMDIFGALLTGASIHIIEPVRPAAELWQQLAKARASVLHCTPTLYRHLLATTAAAVPDTFRLVVLGGERVTGDDLHTFFQHFPEHCALVSGLSATECSVALQHLARRPDLLASSVPAGHPVEGVQVRLVDDAGLPTEVFGELEILSDRVALGYWNQPAATSAVFGEYPGQARFYRTGDLVRRLPDGALVHCGRKDRQVKIRGHRVEPGEIESLLRVHPAVAEAAVRLDPRSPRPRLIAYATPATPATSNSLNAGELSGYLRRHLPDYMVPSQVVRLDVMPVGPTGKLDYARLPLPDDQPADEIALNDDTPRTELERAIAGIWCQVLGRAKMGVRANFMAAGGDSIQLTTMLARLKEDLEADIPILDFLKNPTVTGIADLIRTGN